MQLTRQTIHDRQIWNDLIRPLPAAHFLQTWEWGAFKAITGWDAVHIVFKDADGELVAAASILSRKIGPLRVMYIPKGPLFAQLQTPHVEAVLTQLEHMARRRRAIWLKIDPDIIAGRGIPATDPMPDEDRPDRPDPLGLQTLHVLKLRGWRFSTDQVQFRNTLYHDLTLSDDDMLATMNQSTRRKLRQADKRGVVIRETDSDADLRTLYDIYAVTGDRQDFTIRPWEYYHQLWRSFIEAGLATVFVAEIEGDVVSGIILFHFGERVWYFNGMSSNKHRNHQPNHALQWHALRWARDRGYTVYDWWGAPDIFAEEDALWGVYRFKDGFGGEVVRHIGAWDYVPYPPLYFLYTRLMPLLRRGLRSAGE